ncbi:hypothetical protein JCM6882_004385 [Rhodosporidiobolus microsporus]
MLLLSIVRPHGNGAAGEFPYFGRFGLDDVRVRGKIRTGLDERAHRAPPLVKAVFVRIVCKERAWGKEVRRVIDERRVWSAPEGMEYAVLEDGEYPFEMVVRADCGGPSKTETMSPPKGVEVKWRVETYAITRSEKLDKDGERKDSLVTGKATSELKLYRHSSVPLNPTSSSALEWSQTTPTASTSTDTTPVPPFDYSIRIANQPFGPGTLLPVEVAFRLPPAAGTEVKSISWKLRRTTWNIPAAEGEAPRSKIHDFDFEAVPLATANPSPPPSGSRRTPSPPRPPISFPLASSPAAPVEITEAFGLRLIRNGYTVGETIQSDLYRLSYELSAQIQYKTPSTGTTTLLLPRHLIHLNACSVAPIRRPLPPALVPLLLRRNSDFAALPSSSSSARSTSSSSRAAAAAAAGATSTSSLPASAAAAALSERKHSSTSFLPLPSSGRPSSGRRMSEHSEVALTEPARTRARRDPPVPIAVPGPGLAHHSSPSSSEPPLPSPSSSSVPPLEHPSVSRSSTVETLGPDTPNSMEFLITPITASSRPHFPPVLSAQASSSVAANQQQLSTSSSAAGPHRYSHSHAHPHSHARHSSRSSLTRHRPRTAESVRSNLSIASLASIASGASSLSDRGAGGGGRSLREMSAPLPVTSSSSLLLASTSDGVLGLSLADSSTTTGAAPTFAYTAPDEADGRGEGEDTPMATTPLPPHLPSPSPPSSPELAPPIPHVSVLEDFRDPFAGAVSSSSSAAHSASSPFSVSVIGPDGERADVDGSGGETFIFGPSHGEAKQPPSRTSSNGGGPGEMYVSPRQSGPPASSRRPSGFAPTPLGGVFKPSLQPTAVPSAAAAAAGGAAQSAPSRKGSLVGDFFSRIARRGSKVAP